MDPKVLNRLRTKYKITQKELAAAIHVSPSAISQYERGIAAPSRETESRIASYFNVSINCLNGESDYQDIEENYNKIYGSGATLLETIRSMLRLSDKHKDAFAECVQLYEKNDTAGK